MCLSWTFLLPVTAAIFQIPSLNVGTEPFLDKCLTRLLTRVKRDVRKAGYFYSKETNFPIRFLKAESFFNLSVVLANQCIHAKELRIDPLIYLVFARGSSDAEITESLHESFSSFVCNWYLWRPNRPFIVVVSPPFVYSRTEVVAGKLVRVLWKYMAYNSAIIFINEAVGDSEVYTAEPFDEGNQCGTRPNKLYSTRCKEMRNIKNFPRKRRYHFPNCTFVVSGRETVPFCYLNETGDFSGLDAQLARLIASRSNLSIQWVWRSSPQSGISMFSAHDYYKNVTRNEIDLAIGGAVMMTDFFFNVSYGRSHSTQYLTFYVADIGSIEPWQSLFMMFPLAVWLALAFTFLLCSCTLYVFYRYTFNEFGFVATTMTVYQVLLGKYVPIPKGLSFRLAFSTLLLSFYALTTTYSTFLHSFTINPPIAREIRTINDLISANYTVSLSDTNNKFIKDITRSYLKRALSKLSKNKGLEKSARDLQDKRNFTVLERDSAMDYVLSRSNYSVHKVKYKVSLINNALVIPRGSLYLRRINRIVTGCLENGLVAKWISDILTEKKEMNDHLRHISKHRLKVLGMHDLGPVFILMGIGLTASVLVFITEVSIYHFRERQNRRLAAQQ